MTGARLGPPRADCTVVELDGCISVYHPATQLVLNLNASATAVWRLLDGTRRFDDVVAELAVRHSVPRTRLEADVAGLLHALIDTGVLEQG